MEDSKYNQFNDDAIAGNRAQSTKKQLQKSLIELMQHKPFSRITVKDICSNAGLNRSTYYLHYSNQDTLLNEIQQQAYDDIEKYIRTIQSSDNKVQQIIHLLDYIKANPHLFEILLLNHGGDFKELFMRHFLDILQSEKGVPLKLATDSYIQTFLVNGCAGFIVKWIEDDFGIPSRDLAKLIYTTCHGAVVR